MDDPWGSPWANNDTTTQKSESLSLPPSSFLSPPPKAFFGGSPNLSSSQSPWNDDASGGFGDWAATEQAEITSPLPTAWNSWADMGLGIQAPQPTPKADASGKRSPTAAWPSTSPGLKPVLRSRTSSVFRQPLPDPWATESPWNDNNDNLSPLNGVATPGSRIRDGTATPSEPAIQVVENERNREIPINGIHDDKKVQQHDANWGDTSSTKASSLDIHPGAIPVIETGPHDSPSRTSSTFSIDSEHGPDRQDSPITSVDEGSIHSPHFSKRKASGKVSELVGMYDSLATAAKDTPPQPERQAAVKIDDNPETSLSQRAGIEAEGSPELKYFETAGSEDEDPWKASSPSIPSDRSLTPKAKLKTASIPENDRETSNYETPKPKVTPAAIQQLIEKFGTIKFDIDLSVLDPLFPDVPYSGGDDGGEVSDRVITDNFTTTEERKAWYRISRYGSSRKHNSGDEENYQRVIWHSSQTHDDVMKIVRRWMEEDSFSGRPTLGGSKRISVFNWDSATAPVELDKIFGRKSSVTPSTNSAIAPPPPVNFFNGAFGERKPSVTSVSSAGVTNGNTASPVASFGWSSSVVNSPSVAQPKLASSPASKIIPLSSGGTRVKVPSAFSMNPPPLTRSKNEISKPMNDDDDDEWGEMISSPTTENPTILGEVLFDQDTAKPSTEPGAELFKEPAAFEWQEPIPTPKVSTKLEGGSVASMHSERLPTNVRSSTEGTENVGSAMALAPKADPWASADFSIFDTPSMAAEPVVSVLGAADVALVRVANAQKPPEASSESTLSAAPTKVVLGPIQSSNEEQEQEEFVRKIVRNLPDLSYMLR